MTRAILNGVVLAETTDPVRLEGNIYFPKESLNTEYLEESALHTRCPWKGKASYYDVVVDEDRRTDAAWYYPKPWPLARKIKDHVAFYDHVVDVVSEE